MGSFTASLQLANPTPGDPAVRNVWGDIENTGRTLVDEAYGGVLSLVSPTGTVILTSTQGAVDQGRNRRFVLSGTLTGNVTILWPSGLTRFFNVQNGTIGAFSVTLAVDNGSGSPAGSTVVIPQGQRMECASDGTNLLPLFTATGGSLTVNGNLSVTGAFSITSLSVTSTLAVGSNTATSPLILLNGVAGSIRQLIYQSASSNRWDLFTDNSAESGGPTGSTGANFGVQRYDNSGNAIDQPLIITRADGRVSLKNLVFIGNNVDNTGTGLWVNGAPSTERVITLSSNSSPRWQIVASNTPESGSSAGSDFAIVRCNNSGSALDIPFEILRSTGQALFADGANVAGGLTVQTGGLNVAASGATITGGLSVGGGLSVTSGNLAVAAGSLTTSGTITCTAGNLSIAGTGVFGNTVSAPNFIVTSDERLKTEIRPLAYDPYAIARLRPATFRFKSSDQTVMGFIAQDVERVVPLAVSDSEDGMKHVSMMALIAALVSEVQELRRRVSALERAR